MRHSHPLFKQLFEQLSNANNVEDRLQILRQTQKFAHDELPLQLSKLESLLLEYSPFTILATFAACDLTYLPDLGRPMNPSGEIEQYHIEIIQALILCHTDVEFKKRPIEIREFQELRDLVAYVAYLHAARDLVCHDETKTKQEGERRHLISLLKSHTKAVRNWSYEKQTICTLKELYGPMDDAIEAELGVRVCSVVDSVCTQLRLIDKRLEAHFAKVKFFLKPKTARGAVNAYLKKFNDRILATDQVVDYVESGACSFEDLRKWLLHRSNSYLHEVFAFEPAALVSSYPDVFDGQRVGELFSGWVLRLGDLKNHNREHFFMGNPIWKRPIIQATENVFFWPIGPLFHSFCFEIVEAFVCQSERLMGLFLKRRSKFLEDYTARLLREKFPDAKHFKGSKWVDNVLNQNGENDLLIVFDSIGLVVEQKAGAINDIARRGGMSITQEIDELIVDPAKQAHAFARLLRDNPSVHHFETKSGKENVVDSRQISEYCCLTITLERFGPLATQLANLQSAGLAKNDVLPVPAMSLADLQIVLEILETPFELLHYLTRRSAFELNRKFIGDELDLIAFYIRTGFVEKSMPPLEKYLMIYGMGSELDSFFIQRGSVHGFERPRRPLSGWWRGMLMALEGREVRGRYEIGCILLDTSEDEQNSFELQFRELYAKFSQPSGHEAEAIWNHVKSEVSDAVIVAVAITEKMHSKRNFIVNNFARRAMDETGAVQAVVILANIDREQWPYTSIYLFKGT